MKRYLPHAAIGIGLCIFVYAVFFSSSEEDAIRAQLERLQETIEVKGGQHNPVVRGARVKGAFADIFVKEVSIEIPELTSVKAGRMELVGLATQAPTWYRTASADLGGLRVDIDESETSALVTGAVTLSGTRLSGEPVRDTRTVSIRFDKIEGDWRIVGLTVSAKADEGG